MRPTGIPFDCLEREDQIGGNWCYGKPCSSVYDSTHLISSKRLTEFTDFPMPRHYPEFPGHQQVLEYFRDYTRHFGLQEHIQFNTSVERLEPSDPTGSSSGWQVRLASGERRQYRGVVIAGTGLGHVNRKLYPAIGMLLPGTEVTVNFGQEPFMYEYVKREAANETDEEKTERLRLAADLEKKRLQQEDEEKARIEAQRVAQEMERREKAMQLMAVCGGMLPWEAHALKALEMHNGNLE
ncbi:MAG: hypothetical protein L3J16_05555, partial [Anaerolineales bacterium]|nr:hypothetical protein [Anaerolineales bacterium]